MSDAMWGAFVVIAIIAFSLAGAGAIAKVMDGAKECKVNTDCKSNNYCGSDFACHSFPVIENTMIKTDWTTPAAILGLSIILGALILKKKQQPKKEFY